MALELEGIKKEDKSADLAKEGKTSGIQMEAESAPPPSEIKPTGGIALEPASDTSKSGSPELPYEIIPQKRYTESAPLFRDKLITEDEINDIAFRYGKDPETVKNYIAVYSQVGIESTKLKDIARNVAGGVAQVPLVNLLPLAAKKAIQYIDPTINPKMLTEIEELGRSKGSWLTAAATNISPLAKGGVAEGVLSYGLGKAGEAISKVPGISKAVSAFPKATGFAGASLASGAIGGAFGAVTSEKGKESEGFESGAMFGLLFPSTFYAMGGAARVTGTAGVAALSKLNAAATKVLGTDVGEKVVNLWRVNPQGANALAAKSMERYAEDRGFYEKISNTLTELDKLGLDSAETLRRNLGDEGYARFKTEFNIEDKIDKTTDALLRSMKGERETALSQKIKAMIPSADTVGEEAFTGAARIIAENYLVYRELSATRQGFIQREIGGNRALSAEMPYLELSQLISTITPETKHLVSKQLESNEKIISTLKGESPAAAIREVDLSLPAELFSNRLAENKEINRILPKDFRRELIDLVNAGEVDKVNKKVDAFVSEKLAGIRRGMDKDVREAELFQKSIGNLLGEKGNIDAAFKRYWERRIFSREVKAAGGIPETVTETLFQKVARKLSPGQKKMAIIDLMEGTNLYPIHQRENEGRNKANIALAEFSKRQEALYGKVSDLYSEMEKAGVSINPEKLARYVDKPNMYMSTFTPEELTFANKYKALAHEIEMGRNSFYSELGIKIGKRKSTLFDDAGYLKHVAMRPDMAIGKILYNVSQISLEMEAVLGKSVIGRKVGGVDAIREIGEAEFKTLKSKSELFSETVNAVAYLADSGEIRNSHAFTAALNKIQTMPISKVGELLLPEASAAISRASRREMPMLLREKDLISLDQSHASNTLRIHYVGQMQREKAHIAKMLRAKGNSVAADEIEHQMRIANGWETPDIWRSVLRSSPKAAEAIYRKFEGDDLRVMQEVGKVNDLVRGVTSLMYAGTLGRPTTVFQNLTQSWQTLYPAISRTNAAWAAELQSKAVLDLVFLERALGKANLPIPRRTLAELESLGKIPAKGMKGREELGGIPGEIVRNKAAAFRKGADWSAEKILTLFTASEDINRLIASRYASLIVEGASKGDVNCLKYLRDTGYAGLDRELKPLVSAGKWNEVFEKVETNLIQEGVLVYNKNNTSRAINALGPFLSPFTKWPTEMLGNITYDMQRGAEVEAVRRILQPLFAFGALNILLKRTEEKDPQFADQVRKATGQEGFTRLNPYNSLGQIYNTFLNRDAINRDKFGFSPIVNTAADLVGSAVLSEASINRLFGDDIWIFLTPLTLLDDASAYINLLRSDVNSKYRESYRSEWKAAVKDQVRETLGPLIDGAKEAKSDLMEYISRFPD